MRRRAELEQRPSRPSAFRDIVSKLLPAGLAAPQAHHLHARPTTRLNVVMPYVHPGALLLRRPHHARHHDAGRPAFDRVQTALSFFINSYSSIASYLASINRLTSFERAVSEAQARADQATEASAAQTSRDGLPHHPRGDAVPAQRQADRASRRARSGRGALDLLIGPSGSGKSTLVPRHRRHLALRRRQGRHPRRCPDHVAAAAALPCRRARFARRPGLSGDGRRLLRRGDREAMQKVQARPPRRQARRDRSVGPAPLGRRATATGRARALLSEPDWSLPRRGHRLARREAGERDLRHVIERASAEDAASSRSAPSLTLRDARRPIVTMEPKRGHSNLITPTPISRRGERRARPDGSFGEIGENHSGRCATPPAMARAKLRPPWISGAKTLVTEELTRVSARRIDVAG